MEFESVKRLERAANHVFDTESSRKFPPLVELKEWWPESEVTEQAKSNAKGHDVPQLFGASAEERKLSFLGCPIFQGHGNLFLDAPWMCIPGSYKIILFWCCTPYFYFFFSGRPRALPYVFQICKFVGFWVRRGRYILHFNVFPSPHCWYVIFF